VRKDLHEGKDEERGNSYVYVLYNIECWLTEAQLSEWANECCVTLNEQFCSYRLARTNYISMQWWWYPLCNVADSLSTIFIVMTRGNKQSTCRHYSALGHIFGANQIFAPTR
jgi:hypothetical protein